MRDHPDMRLAEVADESGFSNEQSFFRSFKARTGLTPGEWAGGDRS
jgi:AraC-like DNA-binding protein